jgi:hypothetical protein
LHKNKITQLLKSCTSEELRLLDKFIQSPVHNRHEHVIQLFQYLRKHLDGGERALKREHVFDFLFPGEAFDMQKVHYVSSYLLKVVEEFFAWNEWRSDESSFQLYLLRAYRKHRVESQFVGTFDKTKKALQSNELRDLPYLHLEYQLELERFNFTRMLTGKQEFHLQELSDAQDAAFIAEKLRTACILLSNQTVSKSTYDTGLLPQVLAFIENHRHLEIPAVAVYCHAYRTLANFEDDHSFRQLKKWLTSHRNAFNVNELHDLYIFAINYCIRRLNSGEQDFMAEVFDIYRMGMETDAFVQNGIMTPRTYSNIIMSGLRLKEYEWVGNFIFQYENALPEKQREGFFNYNLARLHYEQKNYREAMPLLLQMEYEDVLLTCLGKILLAKMHFELAEFESLSSLLSSFKTYVNRKKTLGYHRESSLNFIHFTQKLMQPAPGGAVQLMKDIEETKVIAEREWLLGQAGSRQ